jgi:hypothetical protein
VTPPAPTLVVLAAGMGSRYGGMKQLEAAGPGGATLMEYSLYDARRAGFGDVVFVIRDDMAEPFAELAATRFGKRLSWRTVIQRLADVPAGVTVPTGRVKPWGTAHAVLAAAGEVRGPFAVLNADDFYGAGAFAALSLFFRDHPQDRPPSWAVVGYRLRDTLSEAGVVNRGVCRIGPDGWLESVEEVTGLEPSADGQQMGRGASGPRRLDGDALVSMNLWGFTPAVVDLLIDGFVGFFRSTDALAGEYLLPTVIHQAVRQGAARVRVLDPGSQWFGMTHPADRPRVEAALRQLVVAGLYPERLWD